MTVPIPIAIIVACLLLFVLAVASLDIFNLKIGRVREMPFALLPVIWIATDAVLFGWGVWYWSVSKNK